MSDRVSDIKRDVAIANPILASHGVLDALGHVSARRPLDPTHFFISRSLGPELVTPADLQEFAFDGREVSGGPRPPYAERAIHAGIYAARPDVLALERCYELLRPGYSVGELVAACADSVVDAPFSCRILMHGKGIGDDAPIAIYGARDKRMSDWPIETTRVSSSSRWY
ncbi:MAG: class II aldolase/adducin family protein [Chloroflexi bacterium]|nr:class II aldolase/adducin family protein [Chloroflexota bacterium]